MSEFAETLLLKAILDSGTYEKAHELIVGSAGALTEDGARALEAQAMRFVDENEPGLAAIFAELAVVASIVVGNNQAKGQAQYGKGVLLGRLKRHEDARGPLYDAQMYFRLAGERRLLANSLYDTARCLAELGRHEAAMELLAESIEYQTE